jgi:hypothetical protein
LRQTEGNAFGRFFLRQDEVFLRRRRGEYRRRIVSEKIPRPRAVGIVCCGKKELNLELLLSSLLVAGFAAILMAPSRSGGQP